MIFDDVTNSYLGRNLLRFTQLDTLHAFENNNLSVLKFLLFYVDLTKEMLHPQVFIQIKELKIEHVLNRIETDLLEKFIYLKNLDLKLENFRDFFHQGNLWMKRLNLHVNTIDFKRNLTRKKSKVMLLRFQYPLNSLSFNFKYMYPVEDLCLFRDFPHERNVYALIQPGIELTCTCTLRWLELYNRYFEPFENMTLDYKLNYVDDAYLLINVKRNFMFCGDLMENRVNLIFFKL